jgi:hypothetical protein
MTIASFHPLSLLVLHIELQSFHELTKKNIMGSIVVATLFFLTSLIDCRPLDPPLQHTMEQSLTIYACTEHGCSSRQKDGGSGKLS